MAAKKTGTAVAKTEPKKTAVALPDGVDMSMLVGDGAQQSFKREDLVIPFIKVLQALSPARQKANPEYVKGAEEGMFFNSATKELFDGEEDGILVIPVAYTRSFTEWKPLAQGGGLVKDHGDNGSLMALCTKGDKGQMVTPHGTELVESALYYVIMPKDDGTYDTAALNLKGMQWKKAREWNTKMNKLTDVVGGTRFKTAMYYWAWRLKTIAESNDQGSWYGVVIPQEPEAKVLELPSGAKMYNEAREFAQTVQKGEVKVKMDDDRHDAANNDEDEAI